jgi:hypothetical protein
VLASELRCVIVFSLLKPQYRFPRARVVWGRKMLRKCSGNCVVLWSVSYTAFR